MNLRGSGWGGIDLRSGLQALPGNTFVDCENCYVSSDRTQLKPGPGSRGLAIPRFEEVYAFRAATAGNPTAITASATLYAGSSFQVRITGNFLLNGTYTATSTGAAAFTIPLDSSAMSLTTDGEIRVLRVRHIHDFDQVDGNLVVAGEIGPYVTASAVALVHEIAAEDPARITIDFPHGYDPGSTFSVTFAGTSSTTPSIIGTHTATALRPHEFTIPVNVTSGSIGSSATETVTITTRQSLVGSWVSPTLPTLGSVVDDFAFAPPSAWSAYKAGIYAPQDFSVARERGMMDVTGRRALIAVPGSGCCYQVDTVVPESTRQTHCLGVPRGRLSYATSTATTGGTIPDGDWYVRVAYAMDELPEYGLMSKAQKVTTSGGGTSTITVSFAEPWESLRELPNACSVMIYISPEENGPRHVTTLSRTTGKGNATHVITSIPAVDPNGTRALQTENMPRGANFVRVLRGQALFGGARGSHGLKFDRYRGVTIRPTSGSPSNNSTIEFVRHSEIVGGMGVFPSAYAGAVMLANPPGRPKYVRMLEAILRDGGHQFDTDFNTAGLGSPGTLYEGNLRPERGIVQISEQGFPGVTPVLYDRRVELYRGQDLEGAARLGNGWLLCTEREVYIYQFAADPRSGDPARVSDEHGCNGSPHAMFEIGSTAGGIGLHGPWIYSGGVQWIGERVLPLFRECLADEFGRMRHAFSCVDTERSLVWFGLTRYAGSSYTDLDPGRKGKSGCDFFLLYSYAADAWSTWRVPQHLGKVWAMKPVQFANGLVRVVILAGTSEGAAKLYALDDDWMEGIEDALSIVLDPLFAGTQNTFIGATEPTGIEEGMSYWIARSDGTYVADGSVVSVSGFTVTLDTTVELRAGDTLTVGFTKMRLRTHHLPSQDPDGQWAVDKVHVRGENLSPGNINTNGTLKVTCRSRSNGALTQFFTASSSQFGFFGMHGAVEGLSFRGADIEIDLEVWARSNFAIKDVFVEGDRGR